MDTENRGSQQLYSYLGRAPLWRGIRDKLTAMGARLAPCDARALNDLCAGVTWMQRVPPALLASYRALYVILRGDAAEEEEEINRDILRTVRAETGLLLDFCQGQRGEFAGSINRVLNALALVDGMGYCQGQNYVVDVMLKAGLPERETFCLFLYLLRQGHLHGIYRKEVPMLAGYMDKFEEELHLHLPKLAVHFETEHYPPPLYALEWMTTLFGLAARPLVSLVALDLFLAGARNPVLRLCVSVLGIIEDDLMSLDQEGLLREFRTKAVGVAAESAVVRAFSEGGEDIAHAKASRASIDRPLGWSTGPDYLLVLRSRHCSTVGLHELRTEARSKLLVGNSALQDALLAVTRSLGWGRLRTCWLESWLVARSDHERYRLANESLRFVITNGGHAKAAGFMLGLGGADANAVDSRLLSPLHLTGLFNRPDVARVLLLSGASMKLKGGVTRAVANRGGKLWSALDMAEEACSEGGELVTAGVEVGQAALFVLRGLVCLQCNVKLSKPAPCGECARSFCKSCFDNHFCVGRLDLPKGVAERAEEERREIKAGPYDSAGRRETAGRERWELGSAIGDGWEALFTEPDAGGAQDGNAEVDWVPGGLRRAESLGSKTGTDEDGGGEGILEPGEEAGPWTTVVSVSLGTWERRPLLTSPKDRNRILDNAAAFVRACFPAQTWLQHHMEEDMGLYHPRSRSRFSWGGPVVGLGMRNEYFNPDILKTASSTELHRRMSWVMAESGVPWENSDHTWSCPECFVLFSLNVFRHHCRGCGNVYCSAHAPATPVPPSGRSLKLCWSCVLEGAVPLPGSPGDLPITTSSNNSNNVSTAASNQNSPAVVARRFPQHMSPSAADAGAGTYVAPQLASPPEQQAKSDGNGNGSNGTSGGFLSALVTLIETVAAPITPERSRAGARARARREGLKSATPEERGTGVSRASVLPRSSPGQSPTGSLKKEEMLPPRSPCSPPVSVANGALRHATSSRTSREESLPLSGGNSRSGKGSESESGGRRQGYDGDTASGGQRVSPDGTVPLRGFGPTPRTSRVLRAKLQRDFGSSESTASSTEPGGDELLVGFNTSGVMKRSFPSEAPLKRGWS